MPENEAGGWTSRETGTTEGNQVVPIREGTGSNEGQTLVGGGELSAKGLDAAHDHYGPDTSKASDHGNLDNAPDAG